MQQAENGILALLHALASCKIHSASCWFQSVSLKNECTAVGADPVITWDTKMAEVKRPSHVVLTSHKNRVFKDRPQITWGARTARERGPIIGATVAQRTRNVIGSHGGGYAVYRALAIAAGKYPRDFRSDLENTHATARIGPFDSWTDPDNSSARNLRDEGFRTLFELHIWEREG